MQSKYLYKDEKLFNYHRFIITQSIDEPKNGKSELIAITLEELFLDD